MPVVQQNRSASGERLYQFVMDWTRRIMQIGGTVAGILLAFLLYHILFGIVPRWGTTGAVPVDVAMGVLGTATSWLNIAVVLFLVTLCALYWAEESLGLTLAMVGVALFYGIPFAMDFFGLGQVATWSSTKNTAALTIYNEIRNVGIMVAIPGVILTIKDVVLRCLNGARENRELQDAMEYGGGIKAEKPARPALIGAVAACWQLPFCRTSIRGSCPIFLARSRCWKERVGCMCEEKVIRQIFNPIMRSPDVPREPAKTEGGIQFTSLAAETYELEVPPWARGANEKKAAEKATTTIDRGTAIARMPRNQTLSAAAKRERCRNCVVYNEHQRKKYQLLAPLAVMVMPAIAYVYFESLSGWFASLLSRIDNAMVLVSLDTQVRQGGGFATSMPTIAQYIIIGSLVTVGVTAMVRVLEYFLFKLKI